MSPEPRDEVQIKPSDPDVARLTTLLNRVSQAGCPNCSHQRFVHNLRGGCTARGCDCLLNNRAAVSEDTTEAL